MVNDSSLADGATQFVFDLETQRGVMSLLAAIRASEISPAEKNELRDLVLLYTNGGRDHSVRITIQQKVLSYNIQPLAVAAPEVPSVPGFGASRPAPSFSPSTVATQKTTPTPATAIPTPTPVPQVEPAPVAPPTPAPEPQPAPVAATPAPAPESTPTPAAEPAPAPVSAPEPQPIPQAESTPTPAPTAPTPEPELQPESEQPSTAGYSPDAALQRIREIKSLVNDKVGNPVNLVNIDNVVGREYMTALLDAMKKINSGTSAISAMQRLETAYQAVEKTIKEHGTEPKKPPKATPTPTPVPQVEPAPVAPPTPAPEPQPAPVAATPAPAPESTSTAPAPEPASSSPAAPAPEPTEPVATPVPERAVSAPTPKQAKVLSAETRVTATVENATARREKIENSVSGYDLDVSKASPSPDKTQVAAPIGAPAPIPSKRSENEIESAWGPATDTLKPNVDVKLGTKPKATSLANTAEKLRSPDELLSPSDVTSSSVSGDPLFTKEVDDGLQQLLSEWTLFKKSGLFGTGPNGREHPLFKKVAPLQIPLLLAGRFEGATQEIKQSITDYMNGWRYEQGIIYEQGETFEHYLRRVIRHILDLQKKKLQP